MADFSPDFTADHFALFGLARKQAIDLPTLDGRFRDLQARIHPDRHAQGSAADQRLAAQWSAQVNAAYQTLKSPSARARYALQLFGQDPQIESNTAMPTDFLVNQMEARERVAEARQVGDEAALESVRDQLLAEIRADHEALERMIDGDRDFVGAAQRVRQLLFRDKLLVEIDDAMEAVTS